MNEVVNKLSEIIASDLRAQHKEEWFPSTSADLMDATIKFHKERAQKLRKIREEFEDLMTSPFDRNA